MAKTYLDIVKYMVISKFSIDGLVDKPDIIGAVFGQTEGLLGDELDLRELQDRENRDRRLAVGKQDLRQALPSGVAGQG